MAAGAFYQDTALQQSARGTVEPVYLSQTDSLVTPVGYTSCQRDRQYYYHSYSYYNNTTISSSK